MSNTARLLAAMGTDAVHAHKPGEDDTLCGLSVVDTEDWEASGTPPPRSADFTGRRFYDGVYRLVCQRCVSKAPKARLEMIGQAVPLQEVRIS